MCLVFLSLVLAMTPTVRDRHGHAVGIHLSPSLAPWHGSDRQKEVGGRPLDMVHVGTGKRGRQGAGVLRGFPPLLPGGPKYLSRSTVSTPNFPAVKKHPLDYIVTPFSGKRTRYMAATCPKLGSCPTGPQRVLELVVAACCWHLLHSMAPDRRVARGNQFRLCHQGSCRHGQEDVPGIGIVSPVRRVTAPALAEEGEGKTGKPGSERTRENDSVVHFGKAFGGPRHNFVQNGRGETECPDVTSTSLLLLTSMRSLL